AQPAQGGQRRPVEQGGVGEEGGRQSGAEGVTGQQQQDVGEEVRRAGEVPAGQVGPAQHVLAEGAAQQVVRVERAGPPQVGQAGAEDGQGRQRGQAQGRERGG